MVELIRHVAPHLPIHGSTQMTITSPEGADFVQRLGVERVVVARELSVDEIHKVGMCVWGGGGRGEPVCRRWPTPAPRGQL